MKSLSKVEFVLRFSLILAALCWISLEATPVLADPGGARTVKYSQQDIIPVRAKLRFSTLIVLPQKLLAGHPESARVLSRRGRMAARYQDGTA